VRQIVSSTFVSLDGLIDQLEHWHFPYLDDDINRLLWEQLEASDALLMGRRTYEGFAETWPSQTGEFADKINSMTKYVASTTLEQADWKNTTVLEGDLVQAVTDIKRQPGGDVLLYGFGPVARTLLEGGVLDLARFWVHPVLAGVGGPGDLLFRPGATSKLRLVETRPLPSGVVVLSYEPAGDGQPTG
jgi:dihydrofolate reductase